jgi:hypothetical protein
MRLGSVGGVVLLWFAVLVLVLVLLLDTLLLR